MKCKVVNDIKIYCPKCLTLSNQKSRYKIKCIKIAQHLPVCIIYFQVGKGHYVVPFKTVHRIDSQGYILYKRQKKLKAEYKELAGQDIAAKIKAGEDVHDISIIPEVAFTGMYI